MNLAELDGKINGLSRGQSFTVYGLPDDYYHKSVAFSRSQIVQMARSPLHFWEANLNEDAEKEDEKLNPAFEIGKALHALVLEPDRDLAAELYVYPEINRRTKAGQAEWAEIEALYRSDDNAYLFLSEPECENVHNMAQEMRNHPVISNIFSGGHSELSVFWMDDTTGIPLKVRLDYIRPDLSMLVDLKSCQDARPSAVSKSIFNYGYYFQAGMYRHGIQQTSGDGGFNCDWDNFVFVFMEKARPYACQSYLLDAEDVDLGETEFRQCMEKLAACMKEQNWPGYPVDITPIELPKWARGIVRDKIQQGARD